MKLILLLLIGVEAVALNIWFVGLVMDLNMIVGYLHPRLAMLLIYCKNIWLLNLVVESWDGGIVRIQRIGTSFSLFTLTILENHAA